MNKITNLSHLSPEIISLAQRLHERQQAEQPSPAMRRLFPALEQTGFTAATAAMQFLPEDAPIGAAAYDVPSNVGSLIYRTDTNAPLGVVGERYAIAQNGDLAAKLAEGCEAALPTRALQNIELRESISRNGRFTRFEYSFPEIGADIRQLTGRSTSLKFRVAVVNGFGGTSIRCNAGAIDWYCDNGMTFGEFETSVFRHTSGFNPNKVKAFVTAEAERFKERVSIWQRWALNEINPAEAELCLEEAGMAGRTIKRVMQQLDAEAAERGMTTWAVYSALTYRSSHNSERFGVRNSSNIDNVAEVLDRREREVGQLISHPAMARIGMAA